MHRLVAQSLTLLLASAVPSPAQLSGTSAATQATCQAAAQAPLPAPPAGPLPAAALPSCDEVALYYGLGRPRDLPAALQCARFQLTHPNPTEGDLFAGPGVLSMLFANGEQVPRNLLLATRLVCSNPWAAPAEIEGRLSHLDHIRNALATHTTPPDLHFDLCDDSTSGLSEGSCTAVTTRRRSNTRDLAITALVSTLPAAARQQFPTLQAAETRFAQARSGNEIDLSGTGRGAFMLEEEATLADQFLLNLQRFSQHNLPSTTPAELATLQTQRRSALDQLRSAPADHWQDGTIKPAGIGQTDQTYTALTAEWLRFSALAYPTLPPVAIEAQLLRLRLHQLRSLLR